MVRIILLCKFSLLLTVLQSKVAWNVIRPAPVSSLAELMDEEYAKKLVESEEEPEIGITEDEEDPDLKLALELSKLEAEDKYANVDENKNVSNKEGTDNDHAIAVQLQSEFNEKYALHQQEKERQSTNGLAKGDYHFSFTFLTIMK